MRKIKLCLVLTLSILTIALSGQDILTSQNVSQPKLVETGKHVKPVAFEASTGILTSVSPETSKVVLKSSSKPVISNEQILKGYEKKLASLKGTSLANNEGLIEKIEDLIESKKLEISLQIESSH